MKRALSTAALLLGVAACAAALAAVPTASPLPTCVFESGVYYVGNDILIGSTSTLSALSVQDCCNKCIAVSSCTAFSYSPATGSTCSLKLAKGTAIKYPSVTSGSVLRSAVLAEL